MRTPDSCSGTVNLFPVPKDVNLIKKLAAAISRENSALKSGHFVYNKHLLPKDIIWRREVKDSEGNVMSSVCKRIYI